MSAKHRGLERFTPPEREEQLKKERVAKDVADRIQKAINSIKALQKRYRERGDEKSLLQLLVRIRELGKDAVLVAIARIKRNQWEKLSQEDKIFVEEQKQIALQSAPPSVKLLSEAFQL
jgi:predicted metal-dependent phosphoesterase TrpH